MKKLLIILLALSACYTYGQSVLITNVKVWDGNADAAYDSDVLIENNMVKQVAQNITASDTTEVIDGKGGYLLPGFIDSHTHIALIAPFDQLENEYTGVYVGAPEARWLKIC